MRERKETLLQVEIKRLYMLVGKYNIDFEYYGFFSGAHFVEESDF